MRKLIPAAAAAVALAGGALMTTLPAQATTYPAVCTVIHDGAHWVYADQMVGLAAYGETFYADHESFGNVYGSFTSPGGNLWRMQAIDLSCGN